MRLKLFALPALLFLLAGTCQISLADNGLRSFVEAIAQNDTATADDQTLVSSPLYEKTAREIVSRLTQHYSKRALNDALSQQLLDRYLSDLDPNRLYFLADDIQSLQKYHDLLDDELKKGKVDIAYQIFAIYQQRANQRINALLDTLKQGIDTLHYDADDTILIDRTKADWPADTDQADQLWEKRLTSSVIDMRLDGVKDKEITERLTRRYKNQLKRLGQTKSEDVFQIYMNALTSLYDPHTDYFTPQKMTNFNIDMSHSLEGIGAVLQASDGYTKIVQLVPGGPAATSKKLNPGDRIVGVAQGDKEITNIIGWRLDEVVERIRGPKGSTVKLEVMPATSASEHSTVIVKLTRDKIKLEAQAAKKKVMTVTSHGQDFKIGIITLPAFYQDFDAYRRGDPNYTSSYRDVKKLVTELKSEKVDGLVMDLRSNGGGSLFSAIKLVSLFIDSGPTVQIRDARGNVRVENDVYPGALYQGPMAVLTNRYSASASEIFAGAMQDYGRALIIGDQTFGKGTVQTLLDLNYGDIKITEAKFYRVSGSSNQLKGIIPDISLPFVVDKDDIGESALENALPWDHIKSADYQPMFNFGPYLDELVNLSAKRTDVQPDFVYARDMTRWLLKNKAIKTLSINQKARKALREQHDADMLAMENQKRKAKGEKLLDTLDDLKTDDNPTLGDDEDKKPDAYAKEGGMILGDLIYLMKKQQLAFASFWQ